MRRLAVLSIFALLPLAATAQIYRWTDDKGQVHYSQVPPAGTPAETVAPPPPTRASPNQDALNKSLQDAIKAEPERREAAAKAQAELEQRQEQCRQAREQIALLDSMSGRRRLTTTDEQGNVSRVTDEQSAARRAELEALAARSC